jgi:hypothetical protein
VIDLLAALALAPWAHPLAFRPLPGWSTGASGNVPSLYGPSAVPAPKESAAWIARRVRYRDVATADPPNATLRHLQPPGLIVWAVIYQGRRRMQPSIRLELARTMHLPCCEGAYVSAGVYELTGGPKGAYSVIVRVYFGARPTPASRAEAQRALDRLDLPPLR